MKNLRVTLLLDFYGDILTDKQREVVDYYYNQDLSLAEIAEHEGITRQGVHETVKRGEAILLDMEERLGLAKKFEEMQAGLSRIMQCAKEIELDNRERQHSGRIAERVSEILQIATDLEE